MKIAVLGATGPTGLQIVEQALNRELLVKAIVRNPEALKALQENSTKNENLEVVVADIMSEKDLTTAIRGCHAVVSALGSRSLGFTTTVTLYSDSIKVIVKSMHAADVTRLVCVTSWYTKPTGDEPWSWRWLIRPFLLGRVLDDMARMENYLEDNASNIDYTVVRPPQLLNANLEVPSVIAVEGTSVKDRKGGISRAKVAQYILDILNDTDQYRKMLAIAVNTTE